MLYDMRMEKPKHIVIDGLSFCLDEETGYYLNGTLNLRAHRYAYEKANGPIPHGFDVHHRDLDKSNNEPDNLLALSASDHGRLHGAARKEDPEWLEWSRRNLAENARPKASEWHRSDAGRAWHAQHAREVAANLEPKVFVCEQCGISFEAKPNGINRFCSNACKSAFRRASGADNVTKACEACGNAFNSNRYAKIRTCGRACANRLRAREKRDAARQG